MKPTNHLWRVIILSLYFIVMVILFCRIYKGRHACWQGDIRTYNKNTISSVIQFYLYTLYFRALDYDCQMQVSTSIECAVSGEAAAER